MLYRGDHSQSYEPTILQAIETLSSIAELELDSPIAVAERHEVDLQDRPLTFRTIHWLHQDNADKVVRVVRDTFRVILNYLKHFYKREFGHLVQHESVEGIKTIMILVGEAAKKLDRFSQMIGGDKAALVKDTKEFKELFDFYKRKIAPIGTQESLSKLVNILPVKAVIESTRKSKIIAPGESERVIIDLDSIKNDNDYDLLLIRKEDGSRYFSPRLVRNVKLVCNFEEYFGEKVTEDSTQVLKGLQDGEARFVAKSILHGTIQKINTFLKEAKKKFLGDVPSLLYKAILALMSASHDARVSKNIFSKTALSYFADFQKFLRRIVTSHEYQRLVKNQSKHISVLDKKAVDVVQESIRTLFGSNNISKDIIFFVNELIEQGKENLELSEMNYRSEGPHVAHNLAIDYEALSIRAAEYAHAPLIKALDALNDPEVIGFDPQLLQNLPSSLFELRYPGKTLTILKLPSPTHQKTIQEACVTEEFKSFLRSLSHDKPKRHHLLINLQERTSWREHARSKALEELQSQEEFAKTITVVTMTKDSDFYFQVGPYHNLNQTDIFMQQLLEHIESESAGYFYPLKVRKALFPGFAKSLANAIHKIFFAGQNVLPRSSRMDFIELFYLFFEMKIVEIVDPDSLSFTCKDSVDIGMPQTIELILALKLMNERPLSKTEEEYIKALLFGTPLLVRGRNLFSERFTRMNSIIKIIEEIVEESGKKEFANDLKAYFAPLYKTKILEAVIASIQK